MKLNNNDLIPWFTQDHGTLPESYLKSCREFFSQLRAASIKQQVTSAPECDIKKIESEKI